MAGIVAQYNEIPRIRQVITNKIIYPVGGSNPADVGLTPLPNIRGQVKITLIAGDDPSLGNVPASASFSVSGGFGDFPDDPTQNFHRVVNSEVNCTVAEPALNIFVITTAPDVSGAGLAGTPRQYRMEFSPKQSFGPQIQRTGGALLGNNTLTVRMTKQNVIQDF